MYRIAPRIIRQFSQNENAGGKKGTLSIWKTGPVVRVGVRDAAGPLVQVLGVRGNVAPARDADLDTTQSAGRRREGDIDVYCIGGLQVDDEATGETSWYVLHLGNYYVVDTQNHWTYADGFVYRAIRDRRVSDV